MMARGYHKPNPRQAAFARHRDAIRPLVTQMHADGLTYAEIARRLNAQGYRGPLGGKWNDNGVRRLVVGYRG